MRGSASRLRLDANHQVRISRTPLGDEERVDATGGANQRDVGSHALGDGFEEGQISGPGQVPVLGISHDKIQHVFRRGKHDDGGVPGLGPNPDDLILGLDDAEHLPAVLSDQRQRQGK